MRVIASFVSFSNRSQVPVVLENVDGVEIRSTFRGLNPNLTPNDNKIVAVSLWVTPAGILVVSDSSGLELARVVMPEATP